MTSGAGPAPAPAPGRAPGPHRDTLTVALYLSILGGALLQGGLGALLPYMTRDMPMTHTVESLHITGLAVGGLVASAVAETARRRVGRGRVLLGGVLACTAGSVVLTIAPNPFVSAGAMPFVGFGLTSTLIAGQVLLVALHGRHGPRMIGELNVAYGVGAVVAALALPAIALSALGWRGFAAVPAVLLLVVVLPMLARGARRTPTEGTVATPGGAGDAPTGRLAGALAVMVLCVAVEWAFLFWFATHLTAVAELDERVTSVATAVMWVAVLVGRIAGSRLLGVLRPGTLLAASLAVGVVATVVLSVVTTPLGAAVAGVLAGFAAANLYAASIAFVIASDPARADAGVARGSLLAAVGLLVAPLTLGALADGIGLRTAFAVTVAVATVAAAVLLAVTRRAHDPPEAATPVPTEGDTA